MKSEVVPGGVGESGVDLDGIGPTVVGCFPCGVGGFVDAITPFDKVGCLRPKRVVFVDVPAAQCAVILPTVGTHEGLGQAARNDVVLDDVTHEGIVLTRLPP